MLNKTNLGAGLGDCTKVVDHVSLGHTNTGITNREDFVLLVRGDADVQVLLAVELRRIGEGSVTDFIKGIRAVGDQLSQENFLVGVESVC